MLKIIPNPTVQIPPWPLYSSDSDDGGELADHPTDIYSSDEFRMYEFKVRRCARGRAHDWTDCPFAHPGEKARRRDPRRYHYSGSPCPDFKKAGGCERGDNCDLAHGVFECWLHPARYRTQPCKDGTACRRRVCFFAHTPDQLRVLSPRSPAAAGKGEKGRVEGYDGSPVRMRMGNAVSPTSVLSSSAAAEFGAAASPPVSAERIMMMMNRMSLCGGGGGLGFGSVGNSPVGSRARRAAGFGSEAEPMPNNYESFDGLDIGWISELVK